jgi:hypothetical protein
VRFAFVVVNRVAMVKPERARHVEEVILQAAQRGQLRGPADEDFVISILEQMEQPAQKTGKITVRWVFSRSYWAKETLMPSPHGRRFSANAWTTMIGNLQFNIFLWLISTFSCGLIKYEKKKKKKKKKKIGRFGQFSYSYPSAGPTTEEFVHSTVFLLRYILAHAHTFNFVSFDFIFSIILRSLHHEQQQQLPQQQQSHS